MLWKLKMREKRKGRILPVSERGQQDRLEEHAVKEVYQNEEDTNVVGDMLDALVRGGARRMLAVGLEEEVNGFLGRGRYERGEEFRGYRNGYHPSRELTVGVSAVEVKVPRV